MILYYIILHYIISYYGVQSRRRRAELGDAWGRGETVESQDTFCLCLTLLVRALLSVV